jgi:glycosyltransferase involved in cell wall biosynthesis
MTRRRKLTLYLIFTLTLLAFLIGYRVYLFIHETDYQAINAENIEQIRAALHDKNEYKFAVVGNIRNSMRIFEKRIIPLISENKVDFMVSLGNAVYDGGEGKYRLLYRGLKKLNIPYVLCVGHNEVEDFGAEKFYQHFGPYFFSFRLKNAVFIFLDSTGRTSWKWQLHWLEEQLKASKGYPYKFVFLNDSLFPLPGFKPYESHNVLEEKLSQTLQRLFSKYHVTVVFSSGYPTFDDRVEEGVRYIISGGGGGLLLAPNEPYQFVSVAVGPEQIAIDNVVAKNRLGVVWEKLETLKLYLHSFFYISLFNLLLVFSIISLVALKLYSMILRQEQLYRDFSINEDVFLKKSLRVAMFTNNYLPFLGGVPISIERLYHSLTKAGHMVKIFAPEYLQPWNDPENGSVVRCPSLFNLRFAKFPIVNVFSRKIKQEFETSEWDLVHVHHPFWLGKKGMRLAKKQGIPVILTYHTRLERYTHYLPFPGEAVKRLVAHLLIKRFANRCDAIITPTPSTEEYLRNLGVSALIETIPTGVNMEDYRCWKARDVYELRRRYVADGEFLLISVSRMAKEKNLDFLIDGIAKVKQQVDVPFKCLLVGDGPEKSRLEDKVLALGLEGQIVFTGNLPPRDVALHYLAADLFVFASTSETQGMVLVEAMAGGCPVVAVRASGVYDVVRDGYNGLTADESVNSWAKAVARLLCDRSLLAAFSENSKAFAENFSEEKIVEKVLRLYRRVIILGKSKGDK